MAQRPEEHCACENQKSTVSISWLPSWLPEPPSSPRTPYCLRPTHLLRLSDLAWIRRGMESLGWSIFILTIRNGAGRIMSGHLHFVLSPQRRKRRLELGWGSNTGTIWKGGTESQREGGRNWGWWRALLLKGLKKRPLGPYLESDNLEFVLWYLGRVFPLLMNSTYRPTSKIRRSTLVCLETVN
jgi:hypothetical protein